MTTYLSKTQIKRLVNQRENKPKQPKFGNHKVIIDGEKVADSKHEFNGLLGQFGRYELNGSRDVDHGYLEDFNSKWEAYAKAWQHQQSKVDELQKRVDAVKQLIEEYRDPPTEDKTFQHALSIVAYELEQALKGKSNG